MYNFGKFESADHETKCRFVRQLTCVACRKSVVALGLLYWLLIGSLVAQQPTASTPPQAATTSKAAGAAPAPSPPDRTSSAAEAPRATVPLTIEQIRVNLPASPAGQFEFLRRQRKITLEAIDEATSQLKALTSTITLLQSRRDALDAPAFDIATTVKERTPAELQRVKAELAATQQKLDAAKKNPSSAADVAKIEEYLSYMRNSVADIEEALTKQEQAKKDEEKRSQDLEAAKKAADDELSRLNDEKDKTTQAQLSYQRLLGEIDDMVNQLFIASDVTNSFKLKMSIILSALVAVVIAGFFLVAWSDEQVKRAIFSSESGIQFITLFAIVISVILFGIIGVLEGKELSALLGGLSGYILGRGKQG
jgi:hypothetical protein